MTREVRKGRGQWSQWVGTPSDLAEIAQLAQDLVERDVEGSRLIIEVTAPAFDATLSTAQQLRDLSDQDLIDLTELAIAVDETSVRETPRRIAVTVTRPSPSTAGKSSAESSPVVRLAVTGPDRDWVDLATTRMTERLRRGERTTEKRVGTTVAFAFAATLIAAFVSIALHDEQEGLNAGEVMTIVLFSLAGVLLVLIVSVSAITPKLELLPDEGATKWERMTRRFNVTGRWLLDAILKAAIGAGVVLLINWLT